MIKKWEGETFSTAVGTKHETSMGIKEFNSHTAIRERLLLGAQILGIMDPCSGVFFYYIRSPDMGGYGGIWGIWQDTADTAGYSAGCRGIWGRYRGIKRDTAGYSGIQRDTVGYSRIQWDTAGYHKNILQSTGSWRHSKGAVEVESSDA
jgi:hypothetical protein